MLLIPLLNRQPANEWCNGVGDAQESAWFLMRMSSPYCKPSGAAVLGEGSHRARQHWFSKEMGIGVSSDRCQQYPDLPREPSLVEQIPPASMRADPALAAP